MSSIVYFIERIATGLYLVCAALALFFFRRWLKGRQRLADAEFELEREMARDQQIRAVTWVIGLIQVGLAVYAVANVIAPTLRQDLLNTGIPTPEIVTEFTPAPSGEIIAQIEQTATEQARLGNAGPGLAQTPLPTATSVGTIVPQTDEVVGCESPDAQLQIPVHGLVVWDSITVVGTADTVDFAFYKFEMSGPSTGNTFAPVGGDRTTPVTEVGVLGQLSLAPFQPGTYDFRLVVFDNTSTLRAWCQVRLFVQLRPPTATPPGG
jgi:uncharacterized protein (DUF983 family)